MNWESFAIVNVNEMIINEVFEMDEDRFPEIGLAFEKAHKIRDNLRSEGFDRRLPHSSGPRFLMIGELGRVLAKLLMCLL